MNRTILIYIISVFALSSCSTIQNAGLSKYTKSANVSTVEKKSVVEHKQPEIKFIENIVIKPQAQVVKQEEVKKAVATQTEIKKVENPYPQTFTIPAIESASLLQIKYSILLDTEIEDVTNFKLIEYIEDWFGTKYCMGGSTKNCVDCSAFTQIFFTDMYGLNLPRTAREQYKVTDKISRTELQEGDLLFFNTRGGVSHVGIYLQNNKFIHAGSSEGVTISDIFEPYWVKRFIGVGRVEKANAKPKP